MIRLLLVAVCAVLSIGQAHADDVLHFGARPAWVASVAAPAAKPADGAFTIRVIDFQIRIDERGMHQYVRQIIRINTPEGLQAGGTALVAWQPSYQTATVNGVVIHRGTETIDAMKDGKSFQVLRREAQLESALTISGLLTAIMPVPDLRVGDEIEYSFTVDQANPVLAGHVESMMPLNKLPAADRISLLASWPTGRGVKWKGGPQLPTPVLTRKAGIEQLAILRDGWTAVEVPAGAPGRFGSGALFQIADFADWSTVVGIMRPLFVKSSTIAADSPVMVEVKRIAALSTDPRVRASEALRTVEGQVRYLARVDGLGGYIPATADAVWAARNGDCKGKTVLLLAMLRALGIAAEPVLASATDGDGVDQSLPMPGRFNHVLVRATIDGKTYWLDGTRLGDRSVETLAVPPFHWVLPLDGVAAAPVALIATEPAIAENENRLDLDARDGIDKPAKASGSYIYRGEDAAKMRIGLAALTAVQRDELARKQWTDRYSWITLKTSDVKVDDKSGDVVLSFTGTATMDWDNPGADSAQRYVADGARLGQDIAPKRDKDEDTAPVAVDAQYTVNRETILLPGNGKGFELEGDPIDQTIGGIHYIREATLKDGAFTMTATVRSKPGEISYAEAKAADKRTDLLINKQLYIRAPADFGAPAAEVAVATPPADAGLDTGLTEITRLTLAGKNDDALKLVDARIATGDKAARTLALRGQLLRKLDRTADAGNAYDEALALDRREPLAIIGKAEMLIDAGREEDALILYDRLVLIWPDAPESYRRRAGVRDALGQLDGQLSDLGILIAKKPDDVDAHRDRAWAYMLRGRGVEAVGEARALVKAHPDDESLHTLLASILAHEGKRAEAIAELDKSIALKPSGEAYRVRLWYGLALDAKARLADIVALIKIDPWGELPMVPLRPMLADPAARAAIGTAYQAALDDNPDGNVAITEERARTMAIGGEVTPYLALLDAAVAKKPRDADALNGGCWARATLKADLDTALAQCDRSLAANRQAGTLDSRGLVHLQRGDWAAAAADYGEAVAMRPTMVSSLYGRGIARKHLGDAAGSKADLAAAMKIDATIGDTFAAYGIKP
ncbi:DUF3857 domain-containing protein [Sphingomonas bacterium]|uniref:DUF3857 domain-containing protein n=1 Tax=Sphingomonas bacterium TaxID=1895847 RepID=UPI0026380558|nr:DUF3857 domain-containing protein [Sphingomonas bacterium]